MYEKMAKKITNLFIIKKIIDSSDREVYEYGYEVMFSQISYTIIMIIISLIFGAFYESLAFFVGFSLYRKICGGYHAKTYTRCHLIFATNQILFLLSLIFVPNQFCYILTGVGLITAIVLDILIAPIDHKNKPFNDKEYKKFKRQSIILSIGLCVLCIFIFLLNKNNVFYFSFSVGCFSASISLLYAFLERRENDEKVKEFCS